MTESSSTKQADLHFSAERGGQAYKLAFVVPFIFPFLILSTMLHPRRILSKFLEWAPLRSVGRISYSLYLWQQLFWAANGAAVPIRFIHYRFVGAALAIMMSLLSYFVLEKPLIRVGHHLFNPVTPGHADLR